MDAVDRLPPPFVLPVEAAPLESKPAFHTEGRSAARKLLRRLRGAIGMGLTWAFAWFGAGLVLLLVVGPDAADVPFPLGFGVFGFVAGAVFSGVLAVVEGRRRFDQMSLPRFAGWGAVGGLVLSGIFAGIGALAGESVEILVLSAVFGLAGAGSAAGSLALARKVAVGDLPHAGEGRTEVELSGREAGGLPGAEDG